MVDVATRQLAEPSPITRNLPERRYVGLTDAGKISGLSRSYVHRLIMAGELSAFRVGTRILIDVDALDAFIRRIPA